MPRSSSIGCVRRTPGHPPATTGGRRGREIPGPRRPPGPPARPCGANPDRSPANASRQTRTANGPSCWSAFVRDATVFFHMGLPSTWRSHLMTSMSSLNLRWIDVRKTGRPRGAGDERQPVLRPVRQDQVAGGARRRARLNGAGPGSRAASPGSGRPGPGRRAIDRVAGLVGQVLQDLDHLGGAVPDGVAPGARPEPPPHGIAVVPLHRAGGLPGDPHRGLAARRRDAVRLAEPRADEHLVLEPEPDRLDAQALEDLAQGRGVLAQVGRTGM